MPILAAGRSRVAKITKIWSQDSAQSGCTQTPNESMERVVMRGRDVQPPAARSRVQTQVRHALDETTQVIHRKNGVWPNVHARRSSDVWINVSARRPLSRRSGRSSCQSILPLGNTTGSRPHIGTDNCWVQKSMVRQNQAGREPMSMFPDIRRYLP